MAKGESLEKPKKKGGMVIVIGMGAKPKNMKKSFGRGSDDAKLANRAKTIRRFQSGRSDIDNILERRQVDPDEFHGEFLRRHNMSFEDYLESGKTDVDIQSMIDEIAERAHGQRREQGREESKRARRKMAIREGLLDTDRFREMLRARGIDENTWLRHVRSIPDDELNDDTFNRLADSLRSHPSAEEQTPEDRRQQLSAMGLSELQIEQQLEHDEGFDEDEREKKKNRGADAARADARRDSHEDAESEDEQMERIARLLGARYPPEVAEDMARRYMTRGFHFSPSEHEFNVSMQNQDDDEDPNVGFSAASIGATTPKSETANPRELGPLLRPREGQGEDRIVRPFQMQTSFDNPKNVMDEAWALLKGNPDMTDRGGKSVHPAAMNYAQYARALTDSLQYRGPQNEQEQINLERNPMLGNMDKTQGQVPDRASATLFRNTAESKHPLAQSKLGGETMREHSDFARGRAKRDTHQYMGTDESEFGSDAHVVRMPRGISNTQEEFMDN